MAEADAKTPHKKNGKQQGTDGKTAKKKKTPQKKNTPQKTFLKVLDEPFEQYMSKNDVLSGLKEKKLIQGVLRINSSSYEDAYVDDPDGGPDYYIEGIPHRNRALNDDVVAINILPVNQWKLVSQTNSDSAAPANTATSPSSHPPDDTTVKQTQRVLTENKTDTDKTETNMPPDKTQAVPLPDEEAQPVSLSPDNKHHTHEATPNNTNTPDQIPSVSSQLDHLTVNSKQQTLSDEESPSEGEVCYYYDSSKYDQVLRDTYRAAVKDCVDGDDIAVVHKTPNLDQIINGHPLRMYKRTAKVIFILERRHCRICSCHLKHFDKAAGKCLVSPIDSRLPRLVASLSECPEDFPRNPKKYQSTLFIARILDWAIDSPFALGNLTTNLGEVTEVETHTKRFLIDHNVEDEEFNSEVLQCLPSVLPWSIPKEEIQQRRDFRKDCIFSIDPATARDLDDALHCNVQNDNTVEVGVHIADVSYFVEATTALDEVARRRATSVYLTQRVIPMLPRLLCEELCSLNPDQDRLSFSVVWKMTRNGKILDEWMGRSLIRSCAKLSYDHAQMMIEDQKGTTWGDAMPHVTNGYSHQDLATRINILNKIARSLRRQRFASGALTLNQGKIVFSLDRGTGNPNGVDVYVQRESNKLIEEFMLLANMAVAHRLQKAFPRLAMLRRHPSPKMNKAEDLRDSLHHHGVEVNISNAQAIQSSINVHAAKCTSETQGLAITTLFAKVMENARYFCLGSLSDPTESCHYALSVPLYTHFTSPIRRYADVIVHRMLAQTLGISSGVKMDEDEVKGIADNCNSRKLNSKRVETLSREFFFAIFLRECGPLTESGVIVQVLDKSFDVLAGRLGIVRRVYCDKLGLVSYDHRLEDKKPILTIRWKAKDSDLVITKDLMLFTDVKVILSTEANSINIDAVILLSDVT